MNDYFYDVFVFSRLTDCFNVNSKTTLAWHNLFAALQPAIVLTNGVLFVGSDGILSRKKQAC